MRYSSWSNSYWYTFWANIYSGKEATLDDARFCIHRIGKNILFNVKELHDDMGACLQQVLSVEPEVTTIEIEELKGYMLQFLKDVDKKYQK